MEKIVPCDPDGSSNFGDKCVGMTKTMRISKLCPFSSQSSLQWNFSNTLFHFWKVIACKNLSNDFVRKKCSPNFRKSFKITKNHTYANLLEFRPIRISLTRGNYKICSWNHRLQNRSCWLRPWWLKFKRLLWKFSSLNIRTNQMNIQFLANSAYHLSAGKNQATFDKRLTFYR